MITCHLSCPEEDMRPTDPPGLHGLIGRAQKKDVDGKTCLFATFNRTCWFLTAR